MDGGEVDVVGFVTWVGGLAELFCCEWIDDANLESGGPQDISDDMVIASSAFDDDDDIENLVRVRGFLAPSCLSGYLEERLGQGFVAYSPCSRALIDSARGRCDSWPPISLA